jgi:antitoxin component YwqK of YwqJK toxin-antitoxin module
LTAYPNAEWAESLKNEPQLSALFLKEIILKTVDRFSSFSEKSTSEGRLSVGNAMNLLKTYYSDSNNPITVQQWNENQNLIKFEIETAGEYSLEIFDLMGRLREKRNYNFNIPGQYRDFIDARSRKNEILIARLSFKNGKRIGVVKF